MANDFDWSVIINLATKGGAQTVQDVDQIEKAVKKLAEANELNEKQENQANKATAKRAEELSKSTDETKKSTESINAQRYALYEVAAAYGAVSAALISLGSKTVSTFAEVESGFTKVERTSGAYGDLFAPVEQSLFSLSRAIPVTLDELNDLASRGAQMGIAASGLDEFSDSMARFVATNDTVDATTAAEAFGRLSNLTGVTDWEALGSAVAKVGVEGAATEAQILKTAQELAPFAVQAGMAADEIIGLAGALGSLGVPPERARSAISSLVSVVDKGVSGLNDKLPAYANLIGKSADETARLWKTDPSQFIIEMSNALAVTDDMTATMNDLGLTEKRVSSVFNALATNSQVSAKGQSELEKQIANANWAFKERGELARQFAPIEDDLASKQVKLANAMKEFAYTVALQAEPAIKGLVDVITRLVTGFTDLIRTPAGKFFAGLIATVGTLTTVYTGLKASIALARAMQIAFNTAAGSGAVSGMIPQLRALMGGFSGTAAAATSATAATNGFKGALASTGIGLAVLALGSLAVALMQVGKSAEDAYQKYLGSSSGLSEAISADQVAHTEALSAGLLDVADSYAQVSPVVQELTSSQEENIEAAYQTAELLGVGVPGSADKATGSINNLTLAIGENTLAWVKQSLMANEAFQKLVSSGGLASIFDQTGADFDTAMRIALTQGQEGLVTYWSTLADTNDKAASLFHSGIVEWGIQMGKTLSAMWGTLTQSIGDGFGMIFGDTSALTSFTSRLGPLKSELDGIWGNPTFKSNVNDFNNLLLGTAQTIKSVGGEAQRSGNAFYDLEDGFSGAERGAGKLGNALDSAKEKLVSVSDYANELKGVFDRAFELRFGNEQASDNTSKILLNLRKEAEDAKQKIRDLRDEIRSLMADIGVLQSDINTQKYFLSVALEYGDTKRAEAIQANLAKLQADLAKKQTDLAKKNGDLTKAQDANSKTLKGNTDQAVANRETILSLVKSYQAQIVALANSGASQAELARESERLRQDFIRQATQLGFNRAELKKYENSFRDVSTIIRQLPRNVSVSMEVRGLNPAKAALKELETSMRHAENASNKLKGALGGVGGAGVNGLKGLAAAQDRQAKRTEALMQLNLLQAQQAAAIGPAGKMAFMGPMAYWAQVVKANSYATGGFTGKGGKYEEAGIVHRGEYVIPKELVNQRTGLPYADAMGKLSAGSPATPSYARGGFVAPNPMGGVVDLSARSIQALAQAVPKYLNLDGRMVGEAVSNAYSASNRAGGN